jgi:osmotically-inducible protein OsmY
VKAVADDIEVRLPGASERTDSDIARAAVTALEWSTPVLHECITVTVRHGWVTLEGAVDWPYQKSAAEDTVRHLMDVR